MSDKKNPKNSTANTPERRNPREPARLTLAELVVALLSAERALDSLASILDSLASILDSLVMLLQILL
ncbi:hypothetical protein CGZ94_02360 [Enemella evansiae]|uniref:Uncharacterized protein n=1 Tax=Enemella evansiae TaxID=2016499 RepID=A0A255GSW9_9ACTN|nr:hypothetical protein CGZ94_02360 [Enemella evansiae]